MDGPTLRSLTEEELISIGIKPMLERQAKFIAAKQNYIHMRRLIEGLLDESAMLEEIVQFVWEKRFRSKLQRWQKKLQTKLQNL